MNKLFLICFLIVLTILTTQAKSAINPGGSTKTYLTRPVASQKINADDIDFSSVFYFNIVSCTVLYLIMFFSAPYIADFYDIPELTAVIRVISIKLIISGLKISFFTYGADG